MSPSSIVQYALSVLWHALLSRQLALLKLQFAYPCVPRTAELPLRRAQNRKLSSKQLSGGSGSGSRRRLPGRSGAQSWRTRCAGCKGRSSRTSKPCAHPSSAPAPGLQRQLQAVVVVWTRQDHELLAMAVQGVNHVKHMAAGALAACVSRTLVAPFERVKMECILRQREWAVQPCEYSAPPRLMRLGCA